MSKFIGRRTAAGAGVTDHGLLTGLSDDDHLQYLIVSALRTVDSPTSGISKTGTGSGDVFTLINAGTGSALFIRQSGTTSDADAALDIDNTDNVGRGLAVFTETADPLLPLVQFSALTSSFDEPVLLITHAERRGLALKVLGDGYLSGQLDGPEAITFTTQTSNPIELGSAGIYLRNDGPGEFYFVNKLGEERTWTVDTTGGADAYVAAGCNINVDTRPDGYKEVSLDIQSVAGLGLIVRSTDSCPELEVDVDAYQIGYDDSDNSFIFADNVQDAIKEIDGYLSGGRVQHIRKIGSEADDAPFNTVFSLDGYEYPLNQDRLMVFINGVAQFEPVDFREATISSIEIVEPRDRNDVIDILILPGSLGGGSSTTTLQNVYDNSESNAKNILLNDGQITFTQSLGTGSALRLISSGSVTPTLVSDQGGTGEAARLKSIDPSVATLLIQKDTAARDSVVNTTIVERTTSHIVGGLTGIGSALLTRLENTGTTLFSASRIVTGTESATDAAEKSYLSIELSDDGVLTEHARFTSDGSFGLNTSTPDATMHIGGDGYFSLGLEVAGQGKVHNAPLAPLNIPILTDPPSIINNGDVWITDIGGTREINARIGGVTYSVAIT
jgi:hypothetical protein